ncbi:MAG: hypothetical protein JOZ77_06355 [Candidatus Eremiobacteraeota bacterium]|nr:hypothetical protein [Candidatus Eremiobacteraeota bacterium]
MSTHLPRLLVAIALALGILCSGRFAVAAATSLDDLIAGNLVPSAAPALLGPITSAGRVGWACKPERSAAARGYRQAELPADPSSP